MGSVLAAACAVALIGVGVASASHRATGTKPPFKPQHGNAGGIVPTRQIRAELGPGPLGSGNLTYHNGPVMRTNTVYAIYWLPSGFSFNGDNTGPQGYETILNQFFTDVAHDSGLRTNVYAPLTQYYDTIGGGTNKIAYQTTFAGSTVATQSLPADGCDGSVTGTTYCLTDSQLQTEIQTVVNAQGWPQDKNTMYFLFTPPDVGSCFDDLSGCSYTDYCAYHSSFVTGASTEIIYANQPWTSGNGGCDPGEYPNGSDADPTINVTSHEHNEAITDPNVNFPDGSHLPAWYDAAGFENGDKCAWIFGSVSGSPGSQYNQVINTHHYLLQQEWNNAGSNCVSTLPAQAPTVTSFSPASGGIGSSVTINGTGFGNVTAVKFNGTSATSYTVNSGLKITATVPAGATTGPISVTTSPGTGTSATNFTVTAGVPTITSFTPDTGGDGATVTINGSGFTGATQVSFSLTPATTYTVNSDVKITATLPQNVYGPGKIRVTTPAGTGVSSTNFTPTAPFITDFTPTSGANGSTITVHGFRFTGATSASIYYVPATMSNVTDTQMTLTIPADIPGPGRIRIQTPNGLATSPGQFTPTAPIISSFQPADGKPGDVITVHGTNFTGATGATMYFVPGQITNLTDTQFSFTVPDDVPGNGRIRITTPNGTGASPTQLTYDGPVISGFSPGSGNSGTSVTVNGSNLSGVTAASIFFKPAAVTGNTATSVTLTVPPDVPGPGKIRLTTPVGHATSANQFSPTSPALTSFTPSSGPIGTLVTLTGINFTGVTKVTLYFVDCVFVYNSPTSITVTIPPGVPGPGRFRVTTPNGVGTSDGQFTVTP